MATSIFGLTFDSLDVTKFRAIGLGLSTQLTAMLTKATTSVDINWATVPLPTSGSFATNIEVYTFSDTLQATYPLYLRFEYGLTASSTFTIRLSIGKSCNLTTGVLSGTLFPATIILTGNTNSATPQTCYISNGDGSSINYALAPTLTGSGGALLIERAYNSNGTLNGDALIVSYRSSAASSNSVTWKTYMIGYTSATYNTVIASGIFPMPLVLGSGDGLANGSVTPYFPAACIAPNGAYWLPRVGLGGSRVECAAGTVVTNLLDNNNYIGLGLLGICADHRASPESSMLMRWD